MLRITTLALALLLSLPIFGDTAASQDQGVLSQLPKVLVVRTTVDQNGTATAATLFPADVSTVISNDQAAAALANSLDESKAVPIVPTVQKPATVNGRASNSLYWRWNYGYRPYYGYYGYGYYPYYGNFGYYYGSYYPYSYYPYSYYSYPYRYNYYYNPYYYYWP